MLSQVGLDPLQTFRNTQKTQRPTNGKLAPKTRPCFRCRRVDSRRAGDHPRRCRAENMKLYRINKLNKLGGIVLKKKDVLAVSDRDAVQKAADSEDCPVCDVLKDGKHVGTIV